MKNIIYGVSKLRIHPNSIHEYNILHQLCYTSKNIYNTTLWYIKNHFNNTGQQLGNDIWSIMKNDPNYKKMHSNYAQQTIWHVKRNISSFFALLKKKNNGNYNRNISFPHYLKKNSLYPCIMSSQHVKIINNKLRISVKNLDVNTNYLYYGIPNYININNIREAQIHPIYNGRWFELHIVYQKTININNNLDTNKFLSIDLGINNFIAAIDNNGKSFIINGKPIKSINQWYNKKVSILQNIYTKRNQKYGKQYYYITDKRNRIINNYIKQISAYITKYCNIEKISTVVIGYNPYWKESINIGHKNNQEFVNIPYGKFLTCIRNKLETNGIKCITIEESYTSKCDALSIEELGKHDVYKGKRIKRGLYRSSIGIDINADINGALNIGRKVFGDDYIIRINSSCLTQVIKYKTLNDVIYYNKESR
jgi:IS605 OrfB family transposase